MFISKRRDIILAVVGITGLALCIGTGIFSGVFFDDVVDDFIDKNLRLEPDTEQWDRFIELPLPLILKLYAFNVTNKEDVRLGAKPILEEIGPLVYTQTRKKHSIQLEDETVYYREDQLYHFDTEASHPLKETDTFFSLNLIVLMLYQLLEDLPADLPFDLNEILVNIYGHSDLFDEYVLGEIGFKGIKFCEPKNTNIHGKLVCLLLTLMNLKFVTSNPDGSMTISLFNYRNNTDGGLFNIDRGMHDISKLGEIYSWNGLTSTNYWRGEKSECDDVKGREGTLYPPRMEKKNYDMYSFDICRTARLKFVKDGTEFEGIDTYTYEMDRDIFRAEVPEDSCFCIAKTKSINGEPTCWLDGFLDMYSCFGIPSVVSLPHFLFADKTYQDQVEGLNPSIENHHTTIQIDPISGAPVTGIRRIQFNFIIRPVLRNGKDVPELQHLPRAVMPILWIEEGTSISGDLLDTLQMYMFWLKFTNIGRWVLTGLFALLFVIPIGVIFYFHRKESVTIQS